MAPSRRIRHAVSRAFAPGAITNFFAVDYNSSLHPVGATGGGYVLSEGTESTATISKGHDGIAVSVNGDAGYSARTTRRAVQLLLTGTGGGFGDVRLYQTVGTPIGSGFGSSAASAVSAVYAVAKAAGIRGPRKELALFAHRAEILEQTGLGTASVVYNSVGAGAIIRAGAPGQAKFITVRVPRDLRIVTAFVAPCDKRKVLSSRKISERISSLGHSALEAFLSDPSLDSLASEGEKFSMALGLESPEVKKLISRAKSSGASYASQNMVGYAVHSLTDEDRSRKVAAAMRDVSSEVRVDTFEVGTRRAGVVRSSRR